MYIRNSSKYGKPLKIIHAGEFYVTADNEMIGTLLGSCIAVCLYDPVHRIGGMNHFMLPGKISKVDIFADRSARYGITAMNELIDTVIKTGAVKKNLIAKMFGGGSVLEYKHKTSTIPDDNIRVAKVMLELADIQLTENDVGSTYSRKVLFDLETGSVFLRKTTSKKIAEKVFNREITLFNRSTPSR